MVFVDDVLMAGEEEEEGMRCMLVRLGKYLEEKGLELNREKTKIVRFRKRGGRMKRVNWMWKGVRIEVRKIKYLGYVLQTNGKQEKHVKKRVKREAMMMRQV